MLDTWNNLELIEKFCYLGEMLGKSSGAEEASRIKSEVCCRALCKFNELANI